MGELSRPIMTPLGVLYRSFHESESHALKSAEWAVKLFGGSVTTFDLVPNPKGYEAAIMARVPANLTCVKPRKDADVAWQESPAQAYVLYDALETPVALHFHKHDFLVKPSSTPPMSAYWVFPTK